MVLGKVVVWRNDIERKDELLGFQILTQKFISRCSATSSFCVVDLLYHYYLAALGETSSCFQRGSIKIQMTRTEQETSHATAGHFSPFKNGCLNPRHPFFSRRIPKLAYLGLS
jgi:hypothetical protein